MVLVEMRSHTKCDWNGTFLGLICTQNATELVKIRGLYRGDGVLEGQVGF